MSPSSRHAAAALLSVLLVCCTSWGRPGAWDSHLLDRRPSRLRVTLTDGRRFEILRPVARGDTLHGDTLAYFFSDSYNRRPVAIPLADVRSVSRRTYSGGRTALLGVGIAAGLAGVGAIVAWQISQSIM